MIKALYVRQLGSKDWVKSGYGDEGSWARASGAVKQSANAFRGNCAASLATWVLPNGEAFQLSLGNDTEQTIECVIEMAVAMIRTDGSPETQMKVTSALRAMMAGAAKT